MADASTNGQFMGGNVNAIPTAQFTPEQLAGQYYQAQIQGTGGMPSPGAGLISGMQAGEQLANNAVTAQRNRTLFNQNQADRKARALVPTTMANQIPGQGGSDSSTQIAGQQSTAPAGVHPAIYDSVVNGAKSLLDKVFGGGSSAAAPAVASTPAAPAPPVPPQNAATQAAASQQLGYQRGGPVTAAPGGFVHGQMAIPGQSAFADGGPVPASAPAPAPMQAPAGVPAPVQLQDVGNMPTLKDHVENLAATLQGAELNDAHVPNSQQGVADPSAAPQAVAPATGIQPAGGAAPAPAPAQGGAPSPVPPGQGGTSPAPAPGQGGTSPAPAPGQQAAAAGGQPPAKLSPESVASAAAVQQAASDPASQQGVPQQSQTASGKPHSLTPEFWDKVNKQILQASAAAAMDGQDPNAVFHSLTAMRNSFFQGNILKNLSAANVALLSGDTKAVEQALRNVYYYYPNGSDLSLHHGADGTLQYQDPINPYLDKDGKPTQQDTGKPNYVDVNSEHLKLLGTAALDPMAVADTLTQYRQIPINNQINLMKAQGEQATGIGRQAWGQAALVKSGVDQSRAPYQNLKDLSASYLDRAKASASSYALKLVQGQNLNAQTLKAVNATNSLVDNLVLGPPKQVPDVDKDGNANLSPAAGKVIHDSSRIPAAFQDMGTMDLARVKAWAAGLVAANPTGMTPQAAAQIATFAYVNGKQTHKGADGKPQSNVLVDPQRNTMHVWDAKGNTWRNYPMANGTAVTSATVDPGLAQMASGGQDASGSSAPQASSGTDFSNPPDWMNTDDAGSGSNS